jgi:hypothetical protein
MRTSSINIALKPAVRDLPQRRTNDGTKAYMVLIHEQVRD